MKKNVYWLGVAIELLFVFFFAIWACYNTFLSGAGGLLIFLLFPLVGLLILISGIGFSFVIPIIMNIFIEKVAGNKYFYCLIFIYSIIVHFACYSAVLLLLNFDIKSLFKILVLLKIPILIQSILYCSYILIYPLVQKFKKISNEYEQEKLEMDSANESKHDEMLPEGEKFSKKSLCLYVCLFLLFIILFLIFVK